MNPSVPDWQQRTAQLFGAEGMERLSRAHILVVGVGGVGAYAAEMLCRAGIGEMTMVDADTVQLSNINRQLPATHATVGRQKTDVMQARLLDINPALMFHAIPEYLTEEGVAPLLDAAHYDFIVDAIDDVNGKIYLLSKAQEHNIPFIMSLGMANRFDPMKVKIAKLNQTHTDPLAKKIRYMVKKQGLETSNINVVISEELPQKNREKLYSIMTVPSSAGLSIAKFILSSIIIEK